MEALVDAVPKLASQLGSSAEDAHHAAVAITTTDLVSKSAALEVSWGLSCWKVAAAAGAQQRAGGDRGSEESRS